MWWSRVHWVRLEPFPSQRSVIRMVPGSWFIQRQRRIGRHDSSSSSYPRSLFNLVPADARFPEIFLDIFPVLSQSTWPPPEILGFPYESLSRKSMVIHSWKMSKPSQTSASDNVFQLWKCTCLSDFLICYFVLPGNPQDTSLPSVVCCFEFFFIWVTETGHSSALRSPKLSNVGLG